ncbi:MAG: tetratricopeptide repeat protein, partial [Planctomycetota bacterium]
MGTTLLDYQLRHACLWGFLALWVCTGCSPSTNKTPPEKPISDKSPVEKTLSTPSAIPPLTESFETRLKRAEQLYADQKLEEAWAISKELLIQEPKSVPALFIASQIMAARNNLSGAIQLISQIDPADPQAGPA